MTDAEAIRELMEQYDSHRAKWIALRGDDTGFDDWFTEQIGILTTN